MLGIGRVRIGGGEVLDERGRDRGQVVGRGEDRGVVGVVRGAEEDRLRGRRDRGQTGVVAMADLRGGGGVGGLDLVAVHERHDRDEVARLRPARGTARRGDDEGLVVGALPVGVPPRPLEGPRRERRRPRVAGGEGVPRRAGDRAEGASLDSQGSGGSGRITGVLGLSGGGRARTGWLRVGSVGGHEARIHRPPGFDCGRNGARDALRCVRSSIEGQPDRPRAEPRSP